MVQMSYIQSSISYTQKMTYLQLFCTGAKAGRKRKNISSGVLALFLSTVQLSLKIGRKTYLPGIGLRNV